MITKPVFDLGLFRDCLGVAQRIEMQLRCPQDNCLHTAHSAYVNKMAGRHVGRYQQTHLYEMVDNQTTGYRPIVVHVQGFLGLKPKGLRQMILSLPQ